MRDVGRLEIRNWRIKARDRVGIHGQGGSKIRFVCVVRGNLASVYIIWGHAMAQLDEALRYKLKDREFDSRWCH
jgi:hypothetical protein